MASLITTDIIRYLHPKSGISIRSHVLHPHADITIICIIQSAKENITSVVEDHFLETISSTSWKHGEEDSDFSFVTEKYNHFLTNLAVADEETVGIIFAVERDSHLLISSIGESEVILQENDASPTNIHEDTHGHHRFELISSGEIPINSSVFIVSKSLEGILGDSFYNDCASVESSKFAEMTHEIFTRELSETTHLVRIRKSQTLSPKTFSGTRASKKFDGISKKILLSLQNTGFYDKWRDFKQYCEEFFRQKYNIFIIIFLLSGIVIFFLLLSFLISALFSVTSNQSKDSKNQIIQAKNLIESSQKLISNPSSFDAMIKDAEKILTELDKQKLYTKDVQVFREKIEAMKKEIYDIQSVDLGKKTSLISPESLKFPPIGIFERDKKLFIFTSEGVISDFVPLDSVIKMKSYPTGEIARDYSVLEDGNYYILTESNRIIASRKNSEISYVNVVGQEGWEQADGISTFNGNIYLYNKTEGQVYKHRPGLNGFSAKSALLKNPSPGILDIGIDGGFYLLKDDQKIVRFLTASNTQSGIVLNKIPGEYTIGKSTSSTKINVRPELNYIYILDGNRVWVFLPDAKRFQDVRSWTYIAQIELSSPDEIIDIAVARDGLFYVLTTKGVYDIVFEFVDNNILLRL